MGVTKYKNNVDFKNEWMAMKVLDFFCSNKFINLNLLEQVSESLSSSEAGQ